MARRTRPRKPLSEELDELFKSHPRSAEWSIPELAEHLKRNESSIKANVSYRRMRGQSEKSGISEADRLVLAALTACGDGWHTSETVADEADRSKEFTRRRLSALVHMGFAEVRRGEFSGYRMTKEGMRRLRATRGR